MSYLQSMPEASLMDVSRAYPELAGPLHAFAEQLMRGPSPFTEGERELIAAYVSGLNGCEYCEAVHADVAGRFGIPEGLIFQLKSGLEGATIPAKLAPLLKFVRKLTTTPALIDQGDVSAFFHAGWEDRALTHVTLICGFFNLMNRWVDAMGVKAKPEVVAQAAELLATKGYVAVSELLDRKQSKDSPRRS